MFISRTTREERVTIETALDSAFLKIDQAEQLIYDLIDAFLSDREQKTLDKRAAETIRNNLWIADDLLADAQLEYHLHAGHGDAPCVQQYLESAARAKANVKDQIIRTAPQKICDGYRLSRKRFGAFAIDFHKLHIFLPQDIRWKNIEHFLNIANALHFKFCTKYLI